MDKMQIRENIKNEYDDIVQILLESDSKITSVIYSKLTQIQFENFVKTYGEKLAEWFSEIFELNDNTIILSKYLKFTDKQIDHIVDEKPKSYAQFKFQMKFKQFSKLHQLKQTIIFSAVDDFKKLVNKKLIKFISNDDDIDLFYQANLDMHEIFLKISYLREIILDQIKFTIENSIETIPIDILDFYMAHFDFNFNQDSIQYLFQYPKTLSKIRNNLSTYCLISNFIEIHTSNKVNLKLFVETFHILDSKMFRREISVRVNYNHSLARVCEYFDDLLKIIVVRRNGLLCKLCKKVKKCYILTEKCKTYCCKQCCKENNMMINPIRTNNSKFSLNFSAINMANIEKYKSSNYEIKYID